jgi:uncharacterized repeat protein (TIGR04052 family)
MSRIVAGWSLLALTTFAGAALSATGCGDGGTGTTGTGGGSAATTSGGSGSTGAAGGSGGAGGSTSSAMSSRAGRRRGDDGGMIPFEGRVGKTVFTCKGTYPGVGTAATDVALSDFRLYLHDVKLHQKGGADVPLELEQDGLWQYKSLVMLDFEDKTGPCANGTTETNLMIHGLVPQGTYDGISFKLGVPFELNHSDVATAPPLNLSGCSGTGTWIQVLRIDVASAGALRSFCTWAARVARGLRQQNTCVTAPAADVALTGFDPKRRSSSITPPSSPGAM